MCRGGYGRSKHEMEALRLVSIYIFNGMSRLAHRRRSLPGRPFQIPYPLAYRQMTSQSFGPNDMTAEDAESAITPLDAQSGDQPGGAEQPTEMTPEATGAGDTGEGLPVITEATVPTVPVVIEAAPGAATELLSNELRLKQFMDRLEEETLKLLEPTEEGIKVPRPVPFPSYLSEAPEIPITQTYTSVLRRLYNQKRYVFSKPDHPTVVRKYPKKPRVPPYMLNDIIEQRQKTVKVLLKSQDTDQQTGDEHNLVVAFGKAAKMRQTRNAS